MKTRIFVTLVAFMDISLISSGQQPDNNIRKSETPPSRGVYIDDDKNGVCDNFETRSNNIMQGRGMGYGRGNAWGFRDGNGRGRGYAYCGGYGRGYRRGDGYAGGQASAPGRGMGRGPGRYYIDENKNGVCDRYETPEGKGHFLMPHHR